MDIPNTILFYFCIIFGIIGVLLNGVFLIINFLNQNFKLEYCYFVHSILIANLGYTLIETTFQIYSNVTMPPNLVYSTLCRISGFLYTIVGIASVISQAGLSYHRYVWLLKRSFSVKYFTRKQCICYVIVIYVTTTIISFTYFMLDDYGKHAGLCFIAFQNIPLWHFMLLNLVPIAISYSVNIFCAYKVYLFIRCHTNDRTRTIPSKIVEGRWIVRLIILETSIQLLLELPVSISLIAKLCGADISDIVYAIVYCLFMLHTISDPLVLIAILKPYRLYVVRLLAKFISMDVEQETVTVVSPRQNTTL